MEQTSKELLLKDLCARLPYGVKMINTEPYNAEHYPILTLSYISKDNAIGCHAGRVFMTTSLGSIKPYLFPLSSMTEEQKRDYQYITERWMNDPTYTIGDSFDWLNKNHFDYRGLIPKGLALEATEKMYK